MPQDAYMPSYLWASSMETFEFSMQVPMFIKLQLDKAEEQRKKAEYYRDEGWKQSLIIQEGKNQ